MQMTSSVFTSVRLLWRWRWWRWWRAAACVCLCRLAGAGSVALQAVQYALSQPFDVSVGLWVCVNALQLLQAALFQQHAAVASGCRHKG